MYFARLPLWPRLWGRWQGWGRRTRLHFCVCFTNCSKTLLLSQRWRTNRSQTFQCFPFCKTTFFGKRAEKYSQQTHLRLVAMINLSASLQVTGCKKTACIGFNVFMYSLQVTGLDVYKYTAYIGKARFWGLEFTKSCWHKIRRLFHISSPKCIGGPLGRAAWEPITTGFSSRNNYLPIPLRRGLLCVSSTCFLSWTLETVSS